MIELSFKMAMAMSIITIVIGGIYKGVSLSQEGADEITKSKIGIAFIVIGLIGLVILTPLYILYV